MRKKLFLIILFLGLLAITITACSGLGACDLEIWINSGWEKPVPEIGSREWGSFEIAAQTVGFTPKKLKQFLNELDQAGKLCELPSQADSVAQVPEMKDQDSNDSLKIAQILAVAGILFIIFLVLLAFIMNGKKPPPDFA